MNLKNLPFIVRLLLSVAVVFVVIKISHYYFSTIENYTMPPKIPRQYAQLGLDICSTTPQLIKARFRELSLKNHPDKGGDVAKWRNIIEARDFLLQNHAKFLKANKKYCTAKANTEANKARAKRGRPSNVNMGSAGANSVVFN